MHADLDALLTAIYVLVDDSCPRAGDQAVRPGSPTPSSSRWRSPRCSWDSPTTASSWRWPATGSGTCSPTCPSSPATTSGCGARAPDRALDQLPGLQLASFCDGCGCSTRRRCPAGARARPRSAPNSPATPATATAAPIRLLLGFPALPGLRADGTPISSSSPPPTPPSARSPSRCSSGCRSPATPSSPTRASRARIRALRREQGATLLRPDRRTSSPRFGSLGPSAMDRIGVLDLQGPARPRAPRSPHPARPLRPHRDPAARACRGPLAQLEIGDPGRHFATYGH